MEKVRESSLLPRFSVNRPVTVVVIFIALLVVGYIAYTKIPLEMMPTGFNPPFMVVNVPYPNASPEEVENQIARPVEDILGTVRNVQNLITRANRNNASVVIQFQQGTEMDMAYAEVRDRMDRVKADLPDDVERIFINRFDMSNDATFWIALGIHKEIPDVHYFLEHNLGKRMKRIDGVANVQFIGVDEKNFEIELEMDKISAHKINIFDMIGKLRNSNFTIPSGFVKEGTRRFNIRSIGKFTNIEEIKKLEVAPGILLEDLATVKFQTPKITSLTHFDGNPGIWLRIDKDSGANTVEVHHAVMAALDDEFATNISLQGIKREFVFSQGDLIIDSLADLQETAMWAAIFAIMVLFFFLRHLRMTFVITLSIPISILVTLVVMYFTGETLNLLSLMGLMVSVGLVVDNSVVVLENIFRHRKAGDDAKESAIKGASEVGLAVVMATLTTIVVFLPMILMGSGQMMSFFMARIGLPVVYGLLSSLFVALVFIPLTTTFFTDKGKVGSSKFINWMRDRYVDVLKVIVDRRVEALIVSVFILVGIFMFTADMGYEDDMRGNVNTNFRVRFEKQYSDVTGFPLQLANKVEAWCKKYREKLDFEIISTDISNNSVRFQLFRDTSNTSTPVFEKPLLWAKNLLFLNDMQKDPEKERREFINDNLFKDIGIIEGEAELYAGVSSGDQEGEAIRLQLEGPDYNELRRWGERVRTELKKIPGIIDVETPIEQGREELSVVLNREQAKAANVEIQLAVATISNAVRGVQLPKFQEKDREIDIFVRLQESDRESIADFKNLRIPTNDGREVPLSSIASFTNAKGPSSISHYNRKPNYSLDITGDTDRMDKMMPLVSSAMARMSNGEDYSHNFGGRRRRMMEDQGNFAFALIVAIVFIFLLMGFLFESFALPGTIIMCVPFAFAGSQLLLKLYNMPSNMFSFIGIIIIIGVVVNNGIVLVDLINRLRKEGKDRKEAILQAGFYRFRPILMTAGTTIFSLIPMAFGDTDLVGIPYNPLGMAMIGGLALNSVLTLMLVPVFYTFFDDLKKFWNWNLGLLFGKSVKKAEAEVVAVESAGAES